MNRIRSTATPALAALCAAVLAACGGGGSDAPAPPPVVPASVTISGVAADGPLQGATACYDLDDNGGCDSGEPTSAATDADGRFSFDVDAAAAGQHRVVVVVPATAIDKDTGQAVGMAFTMQSPATATTSAHSVFVSPLTTLVQAHVDATGASVAAARDYVQAQASLTMSPLADYTQDGSDAAKQAATVARLVTTTQQQQIAALASVIGQVDVSGATVSEADVAKASTQAVLSVLPAIAAATLDPAVAAAATPAELQAALDAAAQIIVSTQTDLNATNALATIGVAKLPPDTSPTTAAAGATLRALTYGDANNWFYRAMESSAADNTADAAGLVHFYDVRRQSSLDVFGKVQVLSWGTGSSKSREGDQHWNGSAWVSCPLGTRSDSTPRDAQGRSNYNYCDHLEEGSSQRSALDVSGQSIRDVIVQKVRSFPGTDSGVAYSAWGPSNLDLLGGATFPTGSNLWYYTNRPLASAPAYDVQPTNVVNAYPADVAAGGDTRVTSGLACSTVNSSNSATLYTSVGTLENLVARNPGTPCIFSKGTNADGSSLDSNEWWSNATASLGTVSGAVTQPSGTGSYYNTTALLRVAFAASGNGTSYYSCLQRKADGSTRNCTLIGSGSYSIQTLGDARVMSFSGLPLLTQSTGFSRVFVERGGKVYFGYRNVTGATTSTLRFGMTAGNAILAQLGIPAIAPIPPASAADTAKQQLFATAKGNWLSADGHTVLRFGDGGQYTIAQDAADGPSTQAGVESGTLDIDPATGAFSALVEVDTNWEAGASHPAADDRFTALTATQITTSGGGSFTRLPDDSNGIVGLWAVGSATDPHAVQIAFFGNGSVMLIDSIGEQDVTSACYLAHQGPPGVERASYTFDAASGALHVFGKQVDTNGCGGFFDSSQGAIQNGTANTVADFVVTFSPDKKSATTSEGFTLYRIAPQ